MLSLLQNLILICVLLSNRASTDAMETPEAFLIKHSVDGIDGNLLEIKPEKYLKDMGSNLPYEEEETNLNSYDTKFLLFKVMNGCAQNLKTHTRLYFASCPDFDSCGYDRFCYLSSGFSKNSFYFITHNESQKGLVQYNVKTKQENLFEEDVNNISDCFSLRFSFQHENIFYTVFSKNVPLKIGSTYLFNLIDYNNDAGAFEQGIQCARADYVPDFETFKYLMLQDGGSWFYPFCWELKRTIMIALFRFERMITFPISFFP